MPRGSFVATILILPLCSCSHSVRGFMRFALEPRSVWRLRSTRGGLGW